MGRSEATDITHDHLDLSSEGVLRLIKILIDEDKDDALTFLKEVLQPQIDQANREQ
jgi:hypothetical protein